jgi:hypothetical protein
LSDRHEGDLMLVQQFQDAGEVEQRPGEPIDLVGHDTVDLAASNIGQELLQGRAVEVAPGKAAVVVALGQAGPALVPLAGDIGLGRGPLGIQAIEFFLQALFGRLARVDSAADHLGGSRPVGDAHEATPRLIKRKNK